MIKILFNLSDWQSVRLYAGTGVIISAGVISSWSITIQLRERVTLLMPSLRRIFRYIIQGSFTGLYGGLSIGLLFGLLFGVIIGLVDVLLGELALYGTLEILGGLIGGVMGGIMLGVVSVPVGTVVGLLVGGISGFVLAFLDTPLVDNRPNPKEGVRASLRNALLMSLLAASFFGLPIWFINQSRDNVLLFLVLLNILPPTFTWFGGLAWCQHWALRVVIARQGWLPLRLVPWLDGMVARGVLRRVGGGYIFLHRSLLEYFAELETWPAGSTSINDPS